MIHDKSTKADYEAMEKLEGLFVGLLDRDELESFNRLCDDGLAMRSYEGAAGFMGLPKVRIKRDFSYHDVISE